MSAPVPPARPWAPTLDPTQWGPWGWFRPVTGTRCPTPSPTIRPLSRSYYKGVRQMVQVSDQDMNTHLAEISRVREGDAGCVCAH